MKTSPDGRAVYHEERPTANSLLGVWEFDSSRVRGVPSPFLLPHAAVLLGSATSIRLARVRYLLRV